MYLMMRRVLLLLFPLHCIRRPKSVVTAQHGAAVGFVGAGGGGGSAHTGGAVRSDGPPHGFYLDGSSLPGLNGVYGPRSSDAVAVFGDADDPPAAASGLLYPHDHSGWVLAFVDDAAGTSKWVLLDPSQSERFVQHGSTTEPRGGLDWWHVEGHGPAGSDGGSPAGGQGDDEGGDEDEELELPWLVGAIPNAIYFEQFLSKQRKRDAEISEARKLGTFPETPPGSSDEVEPPSPFGSCTSSPDGLDREDDGGEVVPPGEGWPAAETHLCRARAARRARDFPSAERELKSALSSQPRYAAAHDEYGRMALDAGRFEEAGDWFAALFALDPDAPGLLKHLVRAASAVERARRAPLPSAGGGRCEVLHCGSNIGAEAEAVLTSSEFRCPGRVDKTNWLGDDGYDDTFSVTQEAGSERVVIRREAEMGVAMAHGWGMDLRFSCCTETEAIAPGEVPPPLTEEEMEAARRSSPDHFQVLGVSCDHTLEELRAAYRAASISLHPDRPGGSTTDFARAASAYKCLSEDWCRAAFERGDDMPVRQGGDEGGVSVQVERRFFPERFPHQPFGDPFARGRPNEGRRRVSN